MPSILRESAGHRGVVSEKPVSFQFDKVGEGLLNVIEKKRTRDMPRDLNTLPRGQIRIDLFLGRIDLFLHRAHLGIEIDFFALNVALYLLELLLEFDNGLLKIEDL